MLYHIQAFLAWQRRICIHDTHTYTYPRIHTYIPMYTSVCYAIFRYFWLGKEGFAYMYTHTYTHVYIHIYPCILTYVMPYSGISGLAKKDLRGYVSSGNNAVFIGSYNWLSVMNDVFGFELMSDYKVFMCVCMCVLCL